MSEMRKARKDRICFGAKVVKGQYYIDKGFGQISPLFNNDGTPKMSL